MITISNIYGHGFDDHQLARMEKLGFRIRQQVSRYMGSQVMRFIDFESGPSLELIEVEDDKEYLDFVPEGMIPYCPGISLILPEGSGKTIGDFEAEFQHLQPYPLHVNYDGSLDLRGPGWNYLNFGIPVVRDTFIWLTELEKPRPVRKYDTGHPNSVKGAAGLVFKLDPEGLKELSRLVGERPEEGALSIGGLHAFSRTAAAELPNQHDKVFPLAAVILKAESLAYFADLDGEIKMIEFDSRPAVYIETNKMSWDLLVTA